MFFRSSRSRPNFEPGWRLELQAGPGAPKALPLDSPTLTLGRDPGCDLCLSDDQRVSRRHARLLYEDGEWLVEDLGSANGTFVGRERVLRPTPLAPGDELRMGRTLMVLQGPTEGPALQLVDSEFDGLETQGVEAEADAVLAGLLARLDTEEIEEGKSAPTAAEPEEELPPEPEPQPEPEAGVAEEEEPALVGEEPEPIVEAAPVEPEAEEAWAELEAEEPGVLEEVAEAPVAAEEQLPAAREEVTPVEVEATSATPAPPPPPAPMRSSAPVTFSARQPTAAIAQGVGCVRLEWAAEGLAVRLHFLAAESVSTQELHQALAGLQPPPQVTAQLIEVLGQPGVSIELRAGAGGQPQLLQCAGEIINRLTAAGLCTQVLLGLS